MKKRIICVLLVVCMLFAFSSCIVNETKYDYKDMSKYITLPDFQNYTVKIERDAIQAAIDSYIRDYATEFVVTAGKDVYVDINFYKDNAYLDTTTNETKHIRGEKIEELSKSNYFIDDIGSGSFCSLIENEIILSNSGIGDVITREYGVGDFNHIYIDGYQDQYLHLEIIVLNKHVELGDVVTIRYTGYYLDDEGNIKKNDKGEDDIFDESDSSVFYVGSWLAIEDFEQNLVGALVDEEFQFDIVFPEDYNEESMRNVKARFKVTVTKLSAAALYDNDFVKTYFSDYSTTEEFEDALIDQFILSDAYTYIANNSTVISYPKNEYKLSKKELKGTEEYVLEEYATDLDTYLDQMYGMTRDEFIKSNMKTEMIYYSIAKQSGIAPNDAQLANEKELLISYYKSYYMTYQGLDEDTALATSKSFVKELGDTYVYENVLFTLVEEHLIHNTKTENIPTTGQESITTIRIRENAGVTE